MNKIEDAAKIGVVGRLLDAISPVVEPSESSLMFPLLCVIGNILGPDVYISMAGSKHPPRLNCVLVGPTAKGRKGTAWAYVRELLEEIIPSYVYENIKSGLSSGEGLIHDVRDDYVKVKKNKQTGEVEEEIEQGIEDKRRFIIESEFARVLRVINRDSNILSTVIRDAWDTGNLTVLTKQPYKATNSHISIVGHITQRELNTTLDEVEQENGFANRFMWIYTEREKLVPLGSTPQTSKWEKIKYELSSLLTKKQQKEYKLSKEAESLWIEIYKELAEEEQGLVGVILARGEPTILRISLIYAILDDASEIQLKHLQAGYACYKYISYSVNKIFPQIKLSDKERAIIDHLKNRGEANSTDLHALFNNSSSVKIPELVSNLIGLELITVETGSNPMGRPEMVYKLVD